MESLIKKEKQAISLIKQLDGLNPELCYSGGKDSDVILTLAQMSGIEFTTIYKQTTIDPPGTEAHVKSKNVTICKPEMTFFELVERKGFPTRRARFCCEKLKEYKINDKAILGIRSSESAKRKKIYKEPTLCRVYSKNERVEQFFPILYWSDEDVEKFVNYYSIKCHPLYYTDDGIFNVKERLGCMGCPLAADNGKSDFVKYQRMARAWMKNGEKYLHTHTHRQFFKIQERI